MRCGRCGTTYGRSLSSAGYALWRCGASNYRRCTPGSINEEPLTQAVLAVFRADSAEIDAAPGTDHVTPPKEQRESRVSVGDELDRVSEALVDLEEKYLMKEIGKDEYDRLKPRLSRRKADLLRRLNELERQHTDEPAAYAPVTKRLLADRDTLPASHRNAMLKRIITVTAHRTSRTEAWVVITTVYGTQHRVDVAVKSGPRGDEGMRLYTPLEPERESCTLKETC